MGIKYKVQISTNPNTKKYKTKTRQDLYFRLVCFVFFEIIGLALFVNIIWVFKI